MPAWSYDDVRSGTERSGEFQLEVGLSILALPRSDRSRTSDITGKRYWGHCHVVREVAVLLAAR
jgi:hypothetical protein